MGEMQKAYWKGADLRERMIPAGLVANVNGEFHWSERQACHRCGGQGGYRHWPGFTCFECGGACYLPYDQEAINEERALALQAAHLKKVARHEARFLKRIAAADAVLLPLTGLGWNQLKDIAAWLGDDIALDVLWKMAHGKVKAPKPLTEKQLALLVRLPDKPAEMAERQAARDAQRADEEARLVDLPAGRQELSGRFVHGKVKINDFGRTVKGMFIAELADGGLAKVWMGIPRGYYRYGEDDEVLVDREELVKLKVTIEPAEDKGFHFGSRAAAPKREEG